MGRKMRRLILLLAVAGAALVLASGVALAAVRIGTAGADRLVGTDHADQINGKGGNDRTIGKAGNDTYYYANRWGVDTLRDTAGIDTLNFSQVSTGVGVYLVPEWGYGWNAAYDGSDKVNMTSYVVENAIGGSGADEIDGGKEDNTLMPGGGGADYLIDWGGYDVDPDYPGYEAIPVSNDTYKGFTANTGLDHVIDYGGDADRLDLSSFYSYEVYIDAVDLNGNGTEESLLILTGENTGVVIEGYFRNRYAGQEGEIEEIIFADGTISDEAEAQALAEASAQDGERAAAAEKLVSEESSQ